MTDVPPEMEFNEEFDEESAPRIEPKRYEYAWEKVAANAVPVSDQFSFTCCGTRYRATNATDIKAMFNSHNAARHGG
jgi:hypothetical protein